MARTLHRHWSATLRPMSAPLVPSPLDYIGHRRFALYPAIKNFEPNEWMLGAGSCTEVQVVNAKTGVEIWIPRWYIGAVSDANYPLLIVGLTKELAYRAGTLEPRVKRVIEMPQKPPNVDEPWKFGDSEARRSAGPAQVVAIRVENREDSPMNKALIALGIASIVSFLALALSALTRI